MTFDFSCKKCGAECLTAPVDGSGATCEDCCEDHDYEYCQYEGWYCKHCGKIPPDDWHDVD